MYLAALKELGEEHEEKRALDFMIRCYNQAPCLLLIKNDKIVGFAGLWLYVPAYGTKRYLRDYMFYIQPAHRGIRSWRELCKGVRDVSDKFKIPFVGEHRLTATLPKHLKMIEMAGAKPVAVLSMYEAQ